MKRVMKTMSMVASMINMLELGLESMSSPRRRERKRREEEESHKSTKTRILGSTCLQERMAEQQDQNQRDLVSNTPQISLAECSI